MFSRNGGNLGENGCVDWIFEQKGVVEVALDGQDPDELTLEAADAGAEDVDPVGPEDTYLTIYTDPAQMEAVRAALEAKKLKIAKAEISMLPKTKVELSEKEALQALRLIDRLEDLDDVQNVYTNAEIPDAVAEQYAG